MDRSNKLQRSNPHRGSNLDEFLREQGILAQTEEIARARASKVADLRPMMKPPRSSVRENVTRANPPVCEAKDIR
jgi:hypothetical protein